EELAPSSNLRRDGKFPQPPIVLPCTAVRVIETSLKGDGKILGEEDFWPRAKRDPLIPPMLRIAIFRSLQNKDRHDRELVVGLKQHVLSQHESSGAVNESSRVINGCAEVAGGPSAILNAKRVISAMPLESL